LARRLRDPERLGRLLLGTAIAVAAGLVFWLQRGLTFGWDEFVWLEIGGFGTLEQFWHPYGGHLILVPYLIFRGVLELFGMSFTAFAVVQVVLLSLGALLLYVYARRRVGPLPALAPALILLFLGGSYPVLLEPMIGIQFLAAAVPGLAAIVFVEREDLPGDVAACALLCLALAGFSEALPFLVGAVVSVALSPGRMRRAWVVAIPILAYGGWRLWAAQFEPTGVVTSNIAPVPAYFSDALAVFGTAVFGLFKLVGPGPWTRLRLGFHDPSYIVKGVLLVLAELAAIGVAIGLLRRRGPIPRTLWPAVAMLLTLFVELGVILAPGRTAAEPRYLYIGVLLLLLVVIELARGVRTTRVTLAVTFGLIAVALVFNAFRFQESRDFLLDFSRHARADMATIELAGKDGDQAFTPNQQLPKVVSGGLVLSSGPWLLTVERYGSVAYSVPELRAQSEDVRVEADRVARRSLRLRLPDAAAPRRGCRRLGAAASDNLVLPSGGAVLVASADTELTGRRWADGFSVDFGELRAGKAALLRIPPDTSGVPWRTHLDPPSPVEVCPTLPE
jgi:hypothetical protein